MYDHLFLFLPWSRCSVGRLLESTFSPTSSSASFSTGSCHSLLHPSKLTRLSGSPETQHLTDLPTVSPPQITPSLSAHKTPLSIHPSCLSHNLHVSLHFSLYAFQIFFLACLSPSSISCILPPHPFLFSLFHSVSSASPLQYLQRRQQENTQRQSRGEPPLPEEDINKMFKPPQPPPRMDTLLTAGTHVLTPCT